MKKLLLTVLILTLSLAVLLIFTGCKEDGPLEPEDVDLDAMDPVERAELLAEASARRLAAAESYEVQTDVKIKIRDIPIAKTTVTETVEGVGTKDYKRRAVSVIQISTGGALDHQIINEGYCDGYIYIGRASNLAANELKSPLSLEEYLLYLEKESDIPEAVPSVVESSKTENGEWSITFSGFDRDYIDSIIDLIGVARFKDRINLSDISVTTCLDSGFYPKTVSVAFDSDGKADTDVKIENITIEYRGINSSKVDMPMLSSYREICDIFTLEQIIAEAGVDRELSSGKYIYDTYKRESYGVNSGTIREHSELEYVIKDNGKIKFNVQNTKNGKSAYYFYSDNLLSEYTEKDGEIIANHRMNNDEALVKVTEPNILPPFSWENVVDMQRGEGDGEYVLTLRMTESFVEYYTGMGIQGLESEPVYEMRVTLDNGEVVAYSIQASMDFPMRSFVISVAYELVATSADI